MTGGIGCAIIGVVTAVLSASVAKVEGASWTQIGLGFGIGIVSGSIGGAAGGALGGALGASSGSAAEFAAAEVGGAVGGALGGALSTYATGQGGLGVNVLLGAVQGAAWAAVGWGLKPGSLNKADAGSQTSGDMKLQKGVATPGIGVDTSDNDHDPFTIEQRQNLIDEHVKRWGFYFMDGKTPQYDPDLGFEGETSEDGTVKIGPKAFQSRAWLDSSLLHESVHIDQIRDGTYVRSALNENEVEAYDREIKWASKTGLSGAELESVQVHGQPVLAISLALCNE